MILPASSYCNGWKYIDDSTGIHLIEPSNKMTLYDVHVGTIHLSVKLTTPFDIKKRKRSLCKVGLMAISTNRIAMTLADVNIKAYLNNSDIVFGLIRRKINHVGRMNKTLNNKPSTINVQKVSASFICP
jgi:hypothetical protein